MLAFHLTLATITQNEIATTDLPISINQSPPNGLSRIIPAGSNLNYFLNISNVLIWNV